MFSDKLHRNWPVNEAFKIILKKSTTNHPKKSYSMLGSRFAWKKILVLVLV